MKLKFPRLPIAEGTADKVLRELGLDRLPIDPTAIALNKEILVQPASSDMTGFSGMLAQWDTQFGIMFATHIESEGFRRFSIGHELGHYFLPGHVEQVLANGPHKSHAGFGSSDPYEQEADFFASALLMPERLLKPILNQHDDGLELVRAISDQCVSSLTAAAVRYARVSRSAVAVVVSKDGEVEFCLFSEVMKEAKVRWLKRRTPVPSGTLTSRFAKDPAKIAAAKSGRDSVDLSDWFDCPASHTVTEDVIGLGSYGKVLTIIYSSRLSNEAEGCDDEESDGEIEERWTPKFHR